MRETRRPWCHLATRHRSSLGLFPFDFDCGLFKADLAARWLSSTRRPHSGGWLLKAVFMIPQKNDLGEKGFRFSKVRLEVRQISLCSSAVFASMSSADWREVGGVGSCIPIPRHGLA